jgi:NADPH:quinone reductase-like Zn-dependent oxidoreductase
MKAAIFNKYGPPEVVTVCQATKPIISPNQILIRVKASSVNSGDSRLRRADPWLVRLMYGFVKPKHPILGVVFAGIVEEVGNSVSKYQVGQRLYGLNDKFLGGHAEYIAIDEDNAMGVLPDMMSFTDAAALAFGATTSLHFLSGLDLMNKSILLNGASGAVGVSIIQIAKSRGALITAITSSKNTELVKSLGATETIDYNLTNIDTLNQEYDIVIDCINNIGMNKIQKHVKQGGIVILISGMVKELLFKNIIQKATPIVGTANPTNAIYEEINQLYIKGNLKPVIQRILPLESIVQAHQIVDSWRKVGSIVISID